jgi:oligo-alginate lyase
MSPHARQPFTPALALLVCWIAAPAAVAAQDADLLPVVWPAHPRLIATETAWTKLRSQRTADPELREFVAALLAQSRGVLRAPTLERRLEGRRLLGVSREALRRITLCAFAYRLEQDPAFLERARSDLKAVAAFEDWNPSHFLDVAEMSTAVALGYDWLFTDLSVEDRALLRGAMIEKALDLGRNGHPSFRSQNNWSQVCIGGLALAALAIGDEEPDLARSVLAAGRRDIESGLRPYRPDGIYPEGPSYWEYGTSYTVLLVAALRSATGNDWDIMKAEGLAESAPWVVHMTGPTGAFYNFADGGARAGLMPTLFFFARELEQPALLRFQRPAVRAFASGGRERLAPLAAFWWTGFDVAPDAELPLFWSGRGRQPVAAWRSSWSDPNAFYFAIKAGGAAANHAHMDGGSFILEFDQVRWAEDLGLQSYHSLEARGVQLWSMTQNSQRWQIFRLGPFAHNTLTLDGRLHNAAGMATLTRADPKGAAIDLTPIFLPGQLSAASRTVSIANNGVIIDDRLEGLRRDTEIRWAMATRAQVQIEGDRALLQIGGKQAAARFVGAQPEVLDISQPVTDLDAPNPGMRLLVVRARPDADGRGAIRVELSRVSNP